MHTGMLWFNNSPRMTLDQKINQAAEYYQKKYGRTPDLCLVHPGLLESETRAQRTMEVAGLTVRPYRPVLPGHIWIGVEDQP